MPALSARGCGSLCDTRPALIEGTGKDTGKGLRIKAVFQADIINPLVGISQVARRQQQFTLAECSARDFPLCVL